MAFLDIKTYPEEVLRRPTEDLDKIDESVLELAGNMAETMVTAIGVGLAAPQVGRSISLIVIDQGARKEEHDPLCLINPRIVEAEGEQVFNEGCLSLPGLYTDVKRKQRIKVEAYGLDEKELVIEAEGYMAVVLQHEIDHLSGKLLLDRISSVKRELYRRKIRKSHKSGEDS